MPVETTVSEARFLDMLSSTPPRKYETAILAGSDFASTNQLLQTYVTSREYDVKHDSSSAIHGARCCASRSC
jgi:hypothetical protein